MFLPTFVLTSTVRSHLALDGTHRRVELVLVVNIGTLVSQNLEAFEVIGPSCVVNGRHLVVVCSLNVSAVLVQHVN